MESQWELKAGERQSHGIHLEVVVDLRFFKVFHVEFHIALAVPILLEYTFCSTLISSRMPFLPRECINFQMLPLFRRGVDF